MHERNKTHWLLFFKRHANKQNAIQDQKYFWHTATYQQAVDILKTACVDKIKPLNEREKRAQVEAAKPLLNYVRGNAPLHLGKTRYQRLSGNRG